ncbi:MAG: tRNA (guanosine(37)-N1)-methyltransferase TrmD, partial [Elusimicrobiota bacterium]
RYEGVDERVKSMIDDEISIGDYVLSGGEIPAMAVTEAVVRLLPGVLGNKESFEKDSFYENMLDYPHYTRPEIFKNMKVPKALTSGDHKQIEAWRREQAMGNTRKKRPDLLERK